MQICHSRRYVARLDRLYVDGQPRFAAVCLVSTCWWALPGIASAFNLAAAYASHWRAVVKGRPSTQQSLAQQSRVHGRAPAFECRANVYQVVLAQKLYQQIWLLIEVVS
eukprot:COSAG01_NODE_7175_length_3318_cov_17.992855_5_plen_109_part_00